MIAYKEILFDTHKLKLTNALKNIDKYKIDNTKTICIFSNKGKYEVHEKNKIRIIERVDETYITSYSFKLHTNKIGDISLYVNTKECFREKTNSISNSHKILIVHKTMYKQYLHSAVTLIHESIYDIDNTPKGDKFYFILPAKSDVMNEMISNEVVSFIETIMQ